MINKTYIMNEKKKQEYDYLTYGAEVKPSDVHRLLDHLYKQYLLNDNTNRPTPLCVWGMHGIGKTQIIKDFAKEKPI